MRRTAPLPARLAPRLGRREERGVYALELALVFPLFIVFVCGIFVFSLAFMSHHLLGNLAAETARQCVARSANGSAAVNSCVQPLGNWLASNLPIICLGNTVTVVGKSLAVGAAGFASTSTYPVDEQFLVVTASCNWTFVPAKNALPGGSLSMPDAGPLVGVAAVPFTVYSGGA